MNEADLNTEFYWITKLLVGVRLSDELLAKEYVRAHVVLGISLDAGMSPSSMELAKSKVDLEALEFVLRKKYPDLRKKFLLCSYLVESKKDGLSIFLKSPSSRVGAWLLLVRAGFMFIGSLIKGSFLKVRYGL